MNDIPSFHDTALQSRHFDLLATVFSHPEDVRDDSRLTADEKRALLASWASDANAVPHLPTLRQLPDGSIVKVSDIFDTLKALDERNGVISIHRSFAPFWQRPAKRRREVTLRRWSHYGRSPDDDDDPPPCPAYGVVRPRGGGGAAYACPEPISA